MSKWKLTRRSRLYSFQVEIPSIQVYSETRDTLTSDKCILTAERTTTEDNNNNNNNTDHNHVHDRYGNSVKGNTLPDECPPSKSSSGEEVWSLYVQRKQDDSKLESREDEDSGDRALAHFGLAEIKCGCSSSARRQRSIETGKDSGSQFATPLTTNADQPQPCVELRANEQQFVRPTCDWRSDVENDVADSPFSHKMVMVNKNEFRHNVTDISCYEGLTKVPLQLQNHASSSAYTKSPFQGEEVVAGDSPKHPNYSTNRVVPINTMKEIQRNAKTFFASAPSSREAHEIKCSYERPLENQYAGVRRCGGLKGGRKDQCSKTWDRRDTLELDPESSNKGAKSKKKGQQDSNFPSNTMRVDKEILSERVGESDFSGIRPFFLARHTDDTSMSMTSDTWTEENIEDRPADILSRYQRFGCYPDRCYHSRSACEPPLLLPEGTECFTGPQVLPPILGTDPAMARSLALTNGNDQLAQTYSFDNERVYSGRIPGPNINLSNSNVSIRNLPPPPPLPFPPCGESEYHVTKGGLQSTAPQAVSTMSNTLFAQALSSTSQVVSTTRSENTGLGLPNNVINQTEIGFSINPTPTTQNVIRSEAESALISQGSQRKQREPERNDREMATATVCTNDGGSTMHPVLHNGNSHISDDESLAALERRVAEACSLVERVLKEREEREKAWKDRAQRQREERTRREQEQERIQKETRESIQRNDNEGTSTGREEGAPSERAALPENPQWLCEHYQRLCRVKFPCCERFYPCHRCHNNSDECQNDNCKAKEAFYIECSVCRHQQAVRKSSVILLPASEMLICGNVIVVHVMKSKSI